MAVNRRPWIEFSPPVFFFQLMLKSHQGPLTLDSILGKKERECENSAAFSPSTSYSLFAGLSQQRANSGRVRVEKCSKGWLLKQNHQNHVDIMIKPTGGEREVTSSFACSVDCCCCDERMCKQRQPLYLWSSPAAGFFPTSRVAQYSC